VKKKTIIFIGIAFLILLIVVISIVKKSGGTIEVETTKVEKGDISPTVNADGLIAAKVAVNIQSQVMGEIIALPFKEGDSVKKGDLLVQINPDTYQRDVSSAKASLDAALVALDEAEVNLTQRKRDYERALKLHQEKIFSDEQLENSKLIYDQAVLQNKEAKTRVAQAKAAYERAQDYLAKTTLRSPIDGVITTLNAKEGETAIMGTMNFAGTVILVVSDLSEIITEVQVDEADFPKLKMGQKATVIIDALGGKKYEGKVIEIGASAQQSTSGLQTNIRQFKVKITITNPDKDLKPGMTTRVKLYADQRTGVLKVPIGAVKSDVKDGEQQYYCLIVEKGKVKRCEIKTGLADDINIEITSGLKEGDEIITGPYRIFKTLKEGEKVKTKKMSKESQGKSEVKVEVS
jgi:HlyD family secretion protein